MDYGGFEFLKCNDNSGGDKAFDDDNGQVCQRDDSDKLGEVSAVYQ